MLSSYLKGYIDALCYPIYRGARQAGCVDVPADEVPHAIERIQRIGCLAVVGRQRPHDRFEVWAVRNHTVQDHLEQLLLLPPEAAEQYHRGVGELLGYSEQHIRIFLETDRPSV